MKPDILRLLGIEAALKRALKRAPGNPFLQELLWLCQKLKTEWKVEQIPLEQEVPAGKR